MKVTFYILLSFLIFASCERKKEKIELVKDTYYYSNLERFEEESNKIYIKLDSLSNFNQLLNEIDKIACDNKTPVVIFENENSNFNLIPLFECSKSRVISCPKARNEMVITKDSINILFLEPIGLDSLSYFANKHIQNYGKDYLFSESPKKAYFSIQKDSLLSLDKVEEILIVISETFNKINAEHGDSLPLSILIGSDKLVEIKPPPPPINTAYNN